MKAAIARMACLVLFLEVLGSAWVYVHVNVKPVDAARQNEIASLLKRVKQLDAEWGADLIRSQAGLSNNYDALVKPLPEFRAITARLASLAESAGGNLLNTAVGEMRDVLDAKADLVERFKSQNALWRNSARYVPVAHTEIATRMGAARGAGVNVPAAEKSVAAMASETLRYSVLPDFETGVALMRVSAQTRQFAKGMSPALRESTENLIAHVEIILEQRLAQSELLAQIAKVATAEKVDAVAAAFNVRFEAQLAEQALFQRYLIYFSGFTLLAITLLVAFAILRGVGEKDRHLRVVDEATSALKSSERKLIRTLIEHEAILNNVSVGVVFVTNNRVIQRCNHRFAELFGYTPDELQNRSIRIIYQSQASYEEVGSKTYPLIARGEASTCESQLMRRDGSLFWCRRSGRAVDPAHPEREVVWVFEDVTEQRAAREDLEMRVRERTAELGETNVNLRREIVEREEAETRLSHLANHDPLTGFPNRRLLRDRSAQALALARRDNKHVAVMVLDLDRFKTINDSLGHVIGDEVLRQTGKRLAGALREGDTVARVGGDEFVILLPQVLSKADAASAARKILGALSQTLNVQGHELHSSASIGIAVYPGDGQTIEELQRNADAAMSHAKETGRENYQFFSASMATRAVLRLGLENDLRRALQRSEMELHYQPRIELATGTLKGMEALIRWNHPTRGMVYPDVFIALAEETGLIGRLGEWVLYSACEQILEWQQQGLTVPPVAVNLSPYQFRQKDIADRILQILDETGVTPSLIELEITESSLMQHTEQTFITLERLREMGLRLAIDDFGVGYSSLSYLKRFAVDQIKIDKSFVQDLSRDRESTAIVSAIVTLARHLQLSVVAEGVETTEQMRLVRDLGCHEVQGFLFSRAVPAGRVPALLNMRWINTIGQVRAKAAAGDSA